MIENIKSPADLKKLSMKEIVSLAGELRDVIIKGVSAGGGHLASSLGAVDLAIALHYIFDAPRDKIIWDVGHQSYAHKLLTGRYDRFMTLRKFKGISGFPKMSESPHDAFGTGHSSTSISAAIGMVEARDILGDKYKVVAVIGDGAMTAGLAFEGLNHAGQLKKDLIVVLNDNEMSISKNVGALSAYLNRILTGDVFLKFKKETRNIIESIPKFGGSMSKFAQKLEEHLKGLFLPGVIFEELGFNYIGPIDGHNIEMLIETFGKLKTSEEPTLIHLITKKGKGYEHSERDPCIYHGIGPFEEETGEPVSSSSAGEQSYSEVFGNILADLADADPRIVAITAAMKEGTGLTPFADRHPDRIYDVGIAEPHAVTFAAGLASQGVRPVVAIYSTFLQRSYDEIVHDVCLQGLPVTFAIDRGGLVGEDGPTHHGVFDLSYLRHIPGLVVMAPSGKDEFNMMLKLAINHEGPAAVRYPRGRASASSPLKKFQIGESETVHDGEDVAILAIGHMVGPAVNTASRLVKEGIRARVVNMRFVKPLDRQAIRAAADIGRIVTVEDNAVQGGFGSAVLESLQQMGLNNVQTISLGIPDEYIEHGAQAELRKICGIDEEGIFEAAVTLVKHGVRQIAE